MEVRIPEYVNCILNALSSAGYTSCVVGGCVRDMILGREPNDWDVATAALPEQVMEMFPKCIPTGIKHGTVTVMSGSQSVEVTTFRTEGGYADHRHPDSVSFVSDMNEDLSRRDFTINAMAITPDGDIADPFGGLKDIESGLIRCVGNPEERFSEDALRMFRAFRFSSRFGFTIEENTFAAILKCAGLALELSAERVRDEIEKIILTSSPEYFAQLCACRLMEEYITGLPADSENMKLMAKLPADRATRWAALCYLLTKENCIAGAGSFLRKLRLDNALIRCCEFCTEMLKSTEPETTAGWKRLLRTYGETACLCAAECFDAFMSEGCTGELKMVISSGECFSIGALAVSGNDLKKLGYSGRELGKRLDSLLDHVIEHPEDNIRDVLLKMGDKRDA